MLRPARGPVLNWLASSRRPVCRAKLARSIRCYSSPDQSLKAITTALRPVTKGLDTRESLEKTFVGMEKKLTQRLSEFDIGRFSQLYPATVSPLETCVVDELLCQGYVNEAISLYLLQCYYASRLPHVRVWIVDTLSKLFIARRGDFWFFLKRLVELGWTEEDLRFYNQLFGIYGRIGTGRSSLMVFLDRLKERSDANEIAVDLLTKMALREGKPILAASIILRCKEYCSSGTLDLCVRAIAQPNTKYGLFHACALQKLTYAFPFEAFSTSESTKARIIELGLSIAVNDFPSLPKDCYHIAKYQGSSPIPASAVMALLRRCLSVEHYQFANHLWGTIKHVYLHNIAQLGLADVAYLVRSFSKSEKYRLNTAKEIVEAIPEEIYSREGLLESLLIYSARSGDSKLLEKLVKSVPKPAPRPVLSSLLNAFASHGDSEGLQRVVSEITSKGLAMHDADTAKIVSLLAKDDFNRACSLVEHLQSQGQKPYKAMAALANRAIEQSHFDMAQHYISILLVEEGVPWDVISLAKNLQLKLLVVQGKTAEARKKWQVWLATNSLPGTRYKLTALRTILDEYVRQNNSQSASWVVKELEELGLTANDIRAQVTKRKRLTPAQRQSWERIFNHS
ncbi:hypothetical protein TRVA0_017S02124 [Trichomonascus vanleenenianus]|uniref:uncharacterized protein n=1 Tax=Trichomonascus vanleenenianus TaxID=2268995 RepID=UPI003EC9593C